MPRGELNLKALLAFERVVQTGSITRAAKALNVSAGAVSRYIAILENDLETLLFDRIRGRMQITSDGQQFYQDVHQSLEAIRRSARMISKRDHRTITIWSYPTFASEWLLPRVDRFYKEVGVRISVITGFDDPDLRRSDLAIVTEENLERGFCSEFLVEERLVPVCSPRLADKGSIDLKDVLSFPIVSSRYRISSWIEWVDRYAGQTLQDVTIDFDQSAHSIRAAIEGLGIALAPDVFIGISVARGSLILPFGRRVVSGDKLYLAWEERERTRLPLRKVIRWICAEMNQCQLELAEFVSAPQADSARHSA